MVGEHIARLFDILRTTHDLARQHLETYHGWCTDGNWHVSPLLRRETAATGPSFLAAATTSG